MVVTERNRDGELAVSGNLDLTHDRDVAVERLAEVPRHASMLAEVLIAVAGADVSTAGAGEAAIRTEGQRDAVLPGEDRTAAGDVNGAGRVSGPAAVAMP